MRMQATNLTQPNITRRNYNISPYEMIIVPVLRMRYINQTYLT